MPITRLQIIEISNMWKLLWGKGKASSERGREHMREFALARFGKTLSERASRNELTSAEAAAYILSLVAQWQTYRERLLSSFSATQ